MRTTTATDSPFDHDVVGDGRSSMRRTPARFERSSTPIGGGRGE
ncbi:hypothetical protein ACFQJD_10870 [Haloplanus sp. GCM10025708]